VEPSVRGRRDVAVAAVVSAGVGLAVQARLNGELGARLGDGVAAALVSTTVGLVVLLVVVPLLPGGRRGLGLVRSALRTGGLRWWHLAGGVSGAMFVASQGISVGSLGVAVFTVAVVGGTAVGSLAADRFGLGPSGRHAITPARVCGAVACVVAVAVAGHDSWGGTGDTAGTPALVLLPVLAGAAVAVQAALNGRVGLAAGSPWPATLINFTVAGAALGVAVIVRVAFLGGPAGRLPADPLLYLAGPIGIGVITVATLTVRRIGVLVFGLASVAGQLLGAVLLDLLTPGPRPSLTTYAGVAITFLALASAARPAGARA
jgi:transporter family-2 protein